MEPCLLSAFRGGLSSLGAAGHGGSNGFGWHFPSVPIPSPNGRFFHRDKAVEGSSLVCLSLGSCLQDQ